MAAAFDPARSSAPAAPHGQRALVWFKRDLRVQDHAALAAAQGCSEVLALFVIEPDWLASPECDAQHVAFALRCLAPLRAALAERGLALQVRVGPVPAVLESVRQDFVFDHLFSHEETGPGWSYTRDRAVAAWCRSQRVQWHEFPQTGVQRRLQTRQGWAGRWQQRMDAPVLRLDGGFNGPPGALGSVAALDDLPTLAQLGVRSPHQPLPAAGEAAAQATLRSFLHERGRDYRRALSSPLTAEQGCSRLSAHLAFGTVSMRQVHQATEARIATSGDRAWTYALRGFAGRLRWHCHFMQKLEDEPAIEFRHFSRSADGLRAGEGGEGGEGDGGDAGVPEADALKLQAWREGRTGFPMVDACMRSLNATGWLNFRMRAMLVSFAAYHLWLHWRAPGLHLARQFLDFEPGIHWSQMQMQSGTTGINTLRIYSPAKQALEHDAKGLFVRRWVPEFGTDAYPAPIVDERAALAFAKERLYGLRATPAARAEAQGVQLRHGSRKAGLPPSGPRAKKPAMARQRAVAEGQGELF